MRAGLGLLDSELEPDSSGKSYLVNTVPQSGEASELHAASLEAKPTEPKVLVEVGELLESCWRGESISWNREHDSTLGPILATLEVTKSSK